MEKDEDIAQEYENTNEVPVGYDLFSFPGIPNAGLPLGPIKNHLSGFSRAHDFEGFLVFSIMKMVGNDRGNVKT